MDLEKAIDDAKRKPPDDWIDPWGEPYSTNDAFLPRPAVEHIVEGLLKKPSLNMMYGAPGSLKTLLVLDLCVCSAAGVPWLPPAEWAEGGRQFETKQVPVMFVDFDNGKYDIHERVEALMRARQLEDAKLPLHYYSFPEAGFIASKKEHIGELIWRMTKYNIGMLWFDNLGVIKGASSENTDDMIPVMNNLRYIVQETEAVVGVLHHQSKSRDYKRRSGETIRGHSSIEASLNLALLVEREEFSNRLQIKPTKMRGNMVYPFAAEFTYWHKINTTDELETAKFFGIPSDDAVSDKALDNNIIDTIREQQDVNKKKLKLAVKELMPDVGLNRIDQRIDKLQAMKKIARKDGKGTEKLYFVP